MVTLESNSIQLRKGQYQHQKGDLRRHASALGRKEEGTMGVEGQERGSFLKIGREVGGLLQLTFSTSYKKEISKVDLDTIPSSKGGKLLVREEAHVTCAYGKRFWGGT